MGKFVFVATLTTIVMTAFAAVLTEAFSGNMAAAGMVLVFFLGLIAYAVWEDRRRAELR